MAGRMHWLASLALSQSLPFNRKRELLQAADLVGHKRVANCHLGVNIRSSGIVQSGLTGFKAQEGVSN